MPKQHRILLATDGSPSAQAALATAAKFPWPPASRAQAVVARLRWLPAVSEEARALGLAIVRVPAASVVTSLLWPKKAAVKIAPLPGSNSVPS